MPVLPSSGSFFRSQAPIKQSTEPNSLSKSPKDSRRTKNGEKKILNKNDSNKNKNKNKTKKTRRGNKKLFKKLNVISTNANGLNNKEEKLKNEIKFFNAAIFSIQETNYSVKGNDEVDIVEVVKVQ